MKVRRDPLTGELMTGLAKIELVTCVVCGITSGDGAPEHDIPYPNIEHRDAHGGELMCDPCAEEAGMEKGRDS